MVLDLSLGGGGDGAEEEQKRRETGGRGIGNDINRNSSSSSGNSPADFAGGDAGGTACTAPPSSRAAASASAAARTGHLSGTMDLKRELAFSRQRLHELEIAQTPPLRNASGVENQNVDNTATLAATAADAVVKSAGAPSLSTVGDSACSAGFFDEAKVEGGGVLLRKGGVEEEGLRAAAEESTEAFFIAWAERFGRLVVALGRGGEPGGDGEGDGGGVGGGGGGGGGGGSVRKDDR